MVWIIPAAFGILVFPWKREGHRILPVLILTAGYLAITFLVGRAVGRYRLPTEFALHLTAAAGCASFFREGRPRNSGEHAHPERQ